MRKIVVMNTKGGCGKTTIATNLASYYAKRGLASVLYDYDPQGSSTRWLKVRSDKFDTITGIAAFENTQSNMTRTFQLRAPQDSQRIIVDTPAALSKDQMFHFARYADVIIIPVLPSSIDSHVAAEFVRQLMVLAKVKMHGTHLAIVANRVRENTKAFRSLERFLSSLKIPVLAHLRDTQNYVKAADKGIGIHEITTGNNYRDKQHWRNMIDSIELTMENLAEVQDSVNHPLR